MSRLPNRLSPQWYDWRNKAIAKNLAGSSHVKLLGNKPAISTAGSEGRSWIEIRDAVTHNGELIENGHACFMITKGRAVYCFNPNDCEGAMKVMYEREDSFTDGFHMYYSEQYRPLLRRFRTNVNGRLCDSDLQTLAAVQHGACFLFCHCMYNMWKAYRKEHKDLNECFRLFCDRMVLITPNELMDYENV